MGCHRLEGNPPIDVILRRSARAKRLSLRVSRLDGRVTLTLPKTAPQAEGVSFLRAREAWLRGHLADLSPVQPVAPGRTVLLRGVATLIVAADIRRPVLQDGRLFVAQTKPAGAQIRGYLKTLAREDLVAASDHYAGKLGRPYTRITLRDTRSRWGSCSSAGGLMYSWRLIMAPPKVLHYVAAHEVAHLAEMNHSARFWAVVARLYPDYAHWRHWLREEGDKLHRIDFGD